MKAFTRTFRPTYMVVAIAAAGLLPLAAHAQAPSMQEMQARYKEDIQRCETLTDPQAKQTCRREAGAALQEARRNSLVRGADMSANATALCQRLPAGQREDCERLMSDSNAVQHGSVSGGGVIRELTITVPADSSTAPGTYGTQPQAPASSYGTQSEAPSGGYGTQQPMPSGGYGTPMPPASESYGTQPMPSR